MKASTLRLTVLVLILAPAVGHACRCIDSGGPLCSSFDEGGTVFRGKVVELTLLRSDPHLVQNLDGTTSSIVQAGQYKVRFQVAEMFQGAPAAEFTVYTAEAGTACGFPFRSGAEYVVFASVDSSTGQLYAGRCSHTHEFHPLQKDPDVAWMRGRATAPNGVSIFGSILAPTPELSRPPRAPVSVRGPMNRDLVPDRNGAYRATRLPPGTYTVSVRVPPGYETPPAETVSIKNKACANVDWPLLYDIHVKGRVLGADGAPVAGMGVKLVKQDRESASGYTELPGLPGLGFTDANGQYSLDNAPPGSYFVVANGFGPTPMWPYVTTYFPSASAIEEAAPVQLGPSSSLKDIDIHFPKALLLLHVNATVELPDGRPADHVQVGAYEIGTTAPFPRYLSGAQTDAAGRASLAVFAGRTYYLTAVMSGGTQQRCGGPLKFIPQEGMQLERIVIEHNWGNCLAQLNPQLQPPQ